MSELEGDEGIQRMLDGLSIKQRLAGLAPEQVLAMYDSEQLLLALPDNALRSLSDDYLATLSEPTRAAIRARIGSEGVEDEVDIRGLEGYDEVVQKVQQMNEGLSEQIEVRKQQLRVLVGRLPPDHALAGLTPEQVLEAFRADPEVLSLTEEQVLAGLPPQEALAIFTPELLLRSLLPEHELSRLTREQRRAGLSFEQALAGLTREQVLLALPDETLGTFSDDYLATLAEPTRTAIRARIGR
jgi:hypothetical protein